MAVVLAFRIAIALTPTAYRLVKWEQASTGQPGPTALGRYLWDRLQGDEDDETLTAAVSAETGMLSSVETVEGTFELRKLQVRWLRNSGAAAGTDDAVTTHHFLYAPGGTPSATWASAQFEAVEAAFATFWGTIDDYYKAGHGPHQHRWYKAGPGIVPPQAPVRVAEPDLVGTGGSGLDQQAPQVAVSVTEKTTDPKSWGRFYLPAMASSAENANGRVDTALCTALADGVDAFYEACIAADVFPVVYSSAKAERETAGGTTLPARAARALPVKSIQVDDLWDVIRSRRYNEPLLRVQRDIAGA